MGTFENLEGAEAAKERLEQATGANLDTLFEAGFEGNPSPDLALTNFERWLRETTDPTLYLDQIVRRPAISRQFLMLLGASQPIADSLIQNPSLVGLLFEPGNLRRVPEIEAIREEGRRLLAAASSHLHALDRLRYLRQRWILAIVLNDIRDEWEQEVVWRSLSNLADVLIDLTADVVWQEFAKQKQVEQKPGLMVIGFGKLGGEELNYSSDVDLVYVVEDGLDESLDRDCTRYFEALGRALSDRMGRGSLYRVDLRLRPYGGAGPIVRSMRAYEAYYKLYAEPWEVQALLRSRPIYGDENLARRWNEMRKAYCFRPKLSEISLEQMLAMKARIEEGAQKSDLKRGEGGIRDVEFLTQILQLVHGHDKPALQVEPTCDALRALERTGLLDHSIAAALIEGYTFLRKMEHRVQFVGDQQTHSIPETEKARFGLAKLMGCADWNELNGILERHRRTIQTLYRLTLKLEPPTSEDRSQVFQQLESNGPAALHWFDLLPESAAFYYSLIHNEGSLGRVRTILTDAPRLVTQFRSSVTLTELLLSGEIEEVEEPARRIDQLALSAEPQQVASTFSHSHTAMLAKWCLRSDFEPGELLSHMTDSLIVHCARRLGVEFDIVALGSYGTREMGPGSDGDLLFLIEDGERQPKAETKAQELLAFLAMLKRLGMPIEFDLRLRPEGRKGLLVRTYQGFKAYDLDGMEMWERFALGHARLVYGNSAAMEVVNHSAYGAPLTPDRLLELTKMKRRVETERVKPQHVRRQVKLGFGGLNDIEWLIHLQEMRRPEAVKAGSSVGLSQRIRNLVVGGLINALEADFLLEARSFLLSLRTRIYLMGIDEDLLPENPDRLNRLATSCGFPDGNSLLARHQTVVEGVRRMYMECLERLKT